MSVKVGRRGVKICVCIWYHNRRLPSRKLFNLLNLNYTIHKLYFLFLTSYFIKLYLYKIVHDTHVFTSRFCDVLFVLYLNFFHLSPPIHLHLYDLHHLNVLLFVLYPNSFHIPPHLSTNTFMIHITFTYCFLFSS